MPCGDGSGWSLSTCSESGSSAGSEALVPRRTRSSAGARQRPRSAERHPQRPDAGPSGAYAAATSRRCGQNSTHEQAEPLRVPAVELTFRHRQVLGTIGRFGATRDRLGGLATSRELVELVNARFVTHEPRRVNRLDAWYLTRDGTAAIGLNPGHVRITRSFEQWLAVVRQIDLTGASDPHVAVVASAYSRLPVEMPRRLDSCSTPPSA